MFTLNEWYHEQVLNSDQITVNYEEDKYAIDMSSFSDKDLIAVGKYISSKVSSDLYNDTTDEFQKSEEFAYKFYAMLIAAPNKLKLEAIYAAFTNGEYSNDAT